MKVRIGFVSNSSSTSFVVRGVRIPIKDAAELLGVSPSEDDLLELLYDKLITSGPLNIYSTKGYFDDEQDYDKEDVILGIRQGELEDGVVIDLAKFKSEEDDKIKKLLKEKLGKDFEQLSTFVQYISNDNY